jgi:hypothetical protein
MKKYFVIKDSIQTTDMGKPFYFKGSYSDGNWCTEIENARRYTNTDEIELILTDDEIFGGGIYEIVTIYT